MKKYFSLFIIFCLNISSLSAKITKLSDEEISLLDKQAIYQILEENGYNPNKLSNAGDTAIHLAVKKKDLTAIKLCVKFGLDPLLPNKALDTPLHIAAEKGSLEIAHYLIEIGSSIYWTNQLGQTPYHKALQHKQNEMVNLFLSFGYQSNDAEIDFLIAQGYNLHSKDNSGNSAIHKAALANNVEIIKVLLGKGVPVDELNKKQCTPLLLAITKGNVEAVLFLIENFANINVANNEGNTPLLLAIQSHKDYLLNILLQQGQLNIETKNNKGINALHYAVAKGNIYAVDALIKKNVDVNIVTSPKYWDESSFWTAQDWDAYGEFNYTKQCGHLAPVATPLAIAERLHPNNKILIELLQSHGAISKYSSEGNNLPNSKTLEEYLK